MNATLTPPANETCDNGAAACGVTETLQKPRYYVTGTQDAYQVKIEMPGVPKSGVKIDFEDNLLTVQGRRNATVPDTWKALHRELSTSDYQLRLRLNAPVDEDKLKASMESGILTLELPIRETAKPRRIEVQ